MFRHILICTTLILTPTIAISQTLAEIELVGGAFCRAGISTDAETAIDRLSGEESRIAEKVQACETRCAPRVNSAEFCAYGSQLAQDDAAMTRLGNAATNAAVLFEGAAAKSHYAVSVLFADFSSTASEATKLLDQTIAALQTRRAGSSAAMPDETRWRLVARNIDDTSMMLAILHTTGLATGDVPDLSDRLNIAKLEFSKSYADVHAALGGAEPVSSGSVEMLIARLETIRVTLAWVVSSFGASADRASLQDATRITTNATALPSAALLASSYRDASNCFTRLSLTMATGNMAVRQSRQRLADCRSFEECRPLDPTEIPDLSLFQRFIARGDEMAKTSAAVTNSMCLP